MTSPEAQVIHTSSGGVGQDGQTTTAAKGTHTAAWTAAGAAANGNDVMDKEGGNPFNIKGKKAVVVSSSPDP